MWYGSTRNNIRLIKMDLLITSVCSLRCKHCSNLMQYYEKAGHERLEDIKLGLKKAFSLIDFTENLFVLGGEPCLYPKFAEVLTEVMHYRDQIGAIIVTSNGISMPNESAMQVLRDNNIPVHISLYPRFVDKQTENARCLVRHGLETVLFDPEWTLRTQREDNDGVNFFRHCHKMAAPCITLRGTQLWYCEFACNAHALGYRGEYVDLTKDIGKTELYTYLDPQEPFQACKYCSGGYNDVHIEAAREQCQTPMRWNT